MVNPLVTVFIPTFNRLAFLQKAVRSVLSQGDFVRLHVLDNASTDGTRDWLRDLQKRNSSVQLTLRDTNIGARRNYVEGFNAVRTPYLVPLADDDQLFQGFLTQALKIAMGDSSLGAVVFQTEFCYNGNRLNLTPPNPSEGKLEPREHIQAWVKSGHYSWSAILWNRTAVHGLGLPDSLAEYGSPSDVWFQFKVFLSYPAFLVRKPGAVFSIHENQRSRALGLEAFAFFGKLNHTFSASLHSSGSFSAVEVADIMKAMATRWNDYTFHHLQNLAASVDADFLKESLAVYASDFFDYCGFDHFPFSRAYDARYLECESLNASLAQGLQQKSEQASRLEAELAQKREQADDLIAQLVKIKSSPSWIVTKPLRWLINRLMRFQRWLSGKGQNPLN